MNTEIQNLFYDYKKFKEFLLQDDKNVNLIDYLGNTFLTSSGHFERQTILLIRFNIDLNVRGISGLNAFHCSCFCENDEMKNLLLQHNANPFLQTLCSKKDHLHDLNQSILKYGKKKLFLPLWFSDL